MIRFTCEVNPSLIQLGVLDDPMLEQRIDERKLALVIEKEIGDDIVLYNIGYVSDLYIAKGALQVSASFKSSIAIYFNSIKDIELLPVLIGYGNDWRLLRFDVKKRI